EESVTMRNGFFTNSADKERQLQRQRNLEVLRMAERSSYGVKCFDIPQSEATYANDDSEEHF
ncbi:MAG: hypothetical protein V3T88_08775, partial [Nitrosomonadaceae bacterium]